MIDMKNFGPAPRTMKDAFEKYVQADARREFDRQRLVDALTMVACTLGAFICAAAIGVMLGW